MILPDEMLNVAEHIVETLLAKFDPAYLEDRYRTVLVEKLREKSARMPPPGKSTAPSQKNVVQLMDMLKKSLDAGRPRMAKPANRRAAAAASRSGDAKRSKRVRGGE